MKPAAAYRTIIMSPDELAALEPYTPGLIYSAPDPEQYFRGYSTAEGHAPMAVQFVADPLSKYPREVWLHVEIEAPAHCFNSCPECHTEFPGVTGASDYIKHRCAKAEVQMKKYDEQPARDEAERIIRRLRGDAAFDEGVSVEWKRSGFKILSGALMYVLGITREDLAESARAVQEDRAYLRSL